MSNISSSDNKDHCDEPENGNTIKPLSWQRVPIQRNPKRRKITDSPEETQIKTSNSFNGLTVDLTEENQAPELQSQAKKPNKPPPIILYGIEDVNKLTELLGTAVDTSRLTYRIINRKQLKIVASDVELYKDVISIIREHGLIGHTFNRKDTKCYRIVIRNLHHTTPLSVIKEALEATGNIVSGEIINAKYGPEKKPTSTFFANLLPGPNNKASKDLKVIFHQTVVIEDPRKRKSVVQCQRCQQYGHTKNYCVKPYRCVNCAEAHKTSECTKIDCNSPATCALCLGPHPANYKGCEVYKEILARKTLQRLSSRHKREEPTSSKTTETTQHLPKNTEKSGKQNKKQQYKRSYAEAVYTDQPQHAIKAQQDSLKLIENIFIKQSEKLDLVLQQMSTLLQLITTLVSKQSK